MAVCRSRRPPSPSFTFGSSMYIEPPNFSALWRPSSIFSRIKASARFLPNRFFRTFSLSESKSSRSPYRKRVSRSAVMVLRSSFASVMHSPIVLMLKPRSRPVSQRM